MKINITTVFSAKRAIRKYTLCCTFIYKLVSNRHIYLADLRRVLISVVVERGGGSSSMCKDLAVEPFNLGT